MFAIISDIHSNLEALAAVLADIEERGIKTIYCLGDVVGYGPNPKECLDLVVQKTEFCVLGNHDYAVFYEPTNFNLGAEQASYWSRDILEAEPDAEARNRRWSFLGNLPMRRSMQSAVDGQQMRMDFIHASPRRPINEYIFPEDVYGNPAKLSLLFERTEHTCFIGHTHLPGVFLADPDFYTPDELGNVYPLVPDEKAIINVGSVGQPRDRDSRASYVYVQDGQVHFVRLSYDFETTVKKIYAIVQLDNFEGDRLREGR
jgi:predicted phosphodiesterase